MKNDALKNGYSLATYDIVTSTNDEARKLAEDDAPSGTVVWSSVQTAGRGRHGNKWISKKGNLYLSIILRMDCDAKDVSQLTFLAALAARDAIPLESDKIYFKWPNDILSPDMRKLGGILLEGKTDSESNVDWLIVGIGLNLNNHPEDAEVDRAALSLNKLGCNVEVDEMLQLYLDNFKKWYDVWNEEGFAPIRESWLENAAFLGETVTITLDSEYIDAKFENVNEDGELVIVLPDGDEITISAGEIFLGRPNDVVSH